MGDLVDTDRLVELADTVNDAAAKVVEAAGETKDALMAAVKQAQDAVDGLTTRLQEIRSEMGNGDEPVEPGPIEPDPELPVDPDLGGESGVRA